MLYRLVSTSNDQERGSAVRTRQLDAGSFNLILDGAGAEVGCVVVEETTRSGTAPDGRPETIFKEFWYLYPGFRAPRGDVTIRLKQVSPVVYLGQSFANQTRVEAYVKAKTGTGWAEVERHTSEVHASLMAAAP